MKQARLISEVCISQNPNILVVKSVYRIVRGPGYFGKARIWFCAISGLVTTTLGGVVAFVPSHQIQSIWIFELKMVLGCSLFLGLAAFLFRYYSGRKRESAQT